jgi:hypothetical protein
MQAPCTPWTLPSDPPPLAPDVPHATQYSPTNPYAPLHPTLLTVQVLFLHKDATLMGVKSDAGSTSISTRTMSGTGSTSGTCGVPE